MTFKEFAIFQRIWLWIISLASAKIPTQNLFAHNFFLYCNQFSNFVLHILQQIKCQILLGKQFASIKQIKIISNNSFSEVKINYENKWAASCQNQ